MDFFCGGFNDYNRFVNLDSIEWRIINHLINSSSVFAEKLWKVLFYNTEDCLLKPNLTRAQKLSIVHTGQGPATEARVFAVPYIDDAWREQTSHLHIFVDGIYPENHLVSKVNVGVELLTHAKLGLIMGEAMGSTGPISPGDIKENGQPIILYKNRSTMMTRLFLAELNGTTVEGVGTLQFNRQVNMASYATQSLWNNREFYGFSLRMSTMVSGVSDSSTIGC